MKKDILFLLPASFSDGEGASFYCADCLALEGLIAHHPELADKLEIRHVDFPRPRKEIVALLGAENQSCPVLAIDAGSATDLRLVKLSTDGRYALIQNADEIGRYLSSRYGTPRPH
jgi:hypothetical protein